MPIPMLNEVGLLPSGIYGCDVDEVGARFGNFQSSDRRPTIWRRFQEYFAEARRSGIIKELLLDGSFVTAKPDPNDIDIIVVVASDHDFGSDLPIADYNLLAQNRVRRRFGFDIVVVKDGSEDYRDAIAFFQQVRQRPGLLKGLLRLRL